MLLEAKLFGTPELKVLGQPLMLGGKTLGLLYTLLLAPHSRANAAALLWGDDGAQSLRQTLVVLRKLPQAHIWLEDHDLLFVQADTDVQRFEAALLAGDSARAIELYQGRLLDGVQLKSEAFMDWLNTERQRLERSFTTALRLEIARLAQNHAQLALGYAERLLQIDPLDETALQIALRLELQLEQREAAHSRLNAFRRVLKIELGTEPLPETLEILGQNNLALRYARVRALLPEQNDVGLFADVLGVAALDLVEVQPVAFEPEIPDSVRLVLHNAIANALKKRFDVLSPQASSYASQIAQQYQKALEPRAALSWWLQAAQIAQKSAQLQVAEAAFFSALWITEDEIPRRDSLLGLGGLAETRGDVALMQAVALELMRLGKVLQDDLTFFHAHHRLAGWAIRSGQAAKALEAATEAVGIAKRIAEPELLASANGSLGTAHMALGQLPEARMSLEFACQSKNPQIQLRAYANLGSVYGMLGQFENALSSLESALTIARASQNLGLVAMILHNLAATSEKLGRLHKSENSLREVVQLATRLGNDTLLLQSTLALAQIHAAKGHWGEAYNTANEALEMAAHSALLPQTQMFLGELEALFGRLEAALNRFLEAKSGFELQGNERLLKSTLLKLALLHLRSKQGADNTVKVLLLELQQEGHQDQFDHFRLEYALLSTNKKQIVWALQGLLETSLSVMVAKARLATLQNKAFDKELLLAAIKTAMAEELYTDVPLGYELLGEQDRAQEVLLLSAAGLPKIVREALLTK